MEINWIELTWKFKICVITKGTVRFASSTLPLPQNYTNWLGLILYERCSLLADMYIYTCVSTILLHEQYLVAIKATIIAPLACYM